MHLGSAYFGREAGAGIEDDINTGIGQDLIGQIAGVGAGDRPIGIYIGRKRLMRGRFAVDDLIRHAAKIRNPP